MSNTKYNKLLGTRGAEFKITQVELLSASPFSCGVLPLGGADEKDQLSAVDDKTGQAKDAIVVQTRIFCTLRILPGQSFCFLVFKIFKITKSRKSFSWTIEKRLN